MGHCGQINLAQVALYGVGAYTTAILISRAHVDPWPATFVGALAGGVIGMVVGLPSLRIRGHYLAIATLGLAVAAETIFTAGGELTGGPLGIGRIPTLPGIDTSEGRDAGYYPLLVGFFAVAWAFARMLVAGPIGSAFGAIRDDHLAAKGVGVNVGAFQLLAFTLAGLLAGMAGALYATWSGYISPDSFRPAQMFFLLTILVVGGMRSLPGLVDRNDGLDRRARGIPAVRGIPAHHLRQPGHPRHAGCPGRPGRLGRPCRAVGQEGGIDGHSAADRAGPWDGTAARSGAGLMALLEVRNLKRSFGGIEAVADVSFDVEAGSIHGLIGPNGSGKTTIFNVLSGYYAPSAGEIVFDGRSIGSKPPHEIVAVGIARTFQNLRLFHTLTVRENVQVAAMHAGVPWWRHALGFPVGWHRSEIAGRQPGGRIAGQGRARPSSPTCRSRVCRMGGSAGSSLPVLWLVDPGCSCLTSRLPD